MPDVNELHQDDLELMLNEHPITQEGGMEIDSMVPPLLRKIYTLEMPPEEVVLLEQEVTAISGGHGKKDGGTISSTHKKFMVVPKAYMEQPEVDGDRKRKLFIENETTKAIVHISISGTPKESSNEFHSPHMHTTRYTTHEFTSTDEKVSRYSEMSINLFAEELLAYSTWWKSPETEVETLKNIAMEIDYVGKGLQKEYGSDYPKEVKEQFDKATPQNGFNFVAPKILVETSLEELLELRQKKLISLAGEGDEEAIQILKRDSITKIQKDIWKILPKQLGVAWYTEEPDWKDTHFVDKFNTENIGEVDEDTEKIITVSDAEGNKFKIAEIIVREDRGEYYYAVWFEHDFLDKDRLIGPLMYHADSLKIEDS